MTSLCDFWFPFVHNVKWSCSIKSVHCLLWCHNNKWCLCIERRTNVLSIYPSIQSYLPLRTRMAEMFKMLIIIPVDKGKRYVRFGYDSVYVDSVSTDSYRCRSTPSILTTPTTTTTTTTTAPTTTTEEVCLGKEVKRIVTDLWNIILKKDKLLQDLSYASSQKS